MTDRYAVIGAGNGGKAMAAHLALMGFLVTLYNRTPDHIEIIKKRGGIELDSEEEGGPRGFARIKNVTSDLGEALEVSDVLMVVLPPLLYSAALDSSSLARLAAPAPSEVGQHCSFVSGS